MKNKNIGFGIFLFSIGIILLLINIGAIDWSILNAVNNLWPLIFVVIGINIIFKEKYIVKIITWILFLIILVVYGLYFKDLNKNVTYDKNFKIENKSDINEGDLKLDFGGVDFNIKSTINSLAEGNNSDGINVNQSFSNKKAYIKIGTANTFKFGNNKYNSSEIMLNNSIPWDFDIDCGAVNGCIDMSELMIRNIDIDCGAGKLDLIYGNKFNMVNTKIDAGASTINITVPQKSGVKIKLDGALNNSNLSELGWKKDGSFYYSPQYEVSSNKIIIDIDMGVGKLNVNIK